MTWQNISRILNKSNKKKNNIKKILINGNITTNKAMIAEEFNSLFVNIGPKLADKIDFKNKKPFNTYLTMRIMSSFHFDFVDSTNFWKPWPRQ